MTEQLLIKGVRTSGSGSHARPAPVACRCPRQVRVPLAPQGQVGLGARRVQYARGFLESGLAPQPLRWKRL